MDHYRILNVTRDADPSVIEKAYKALSLRHHPDLVAPEHRRSATEAMQRLNEAYRVLRDPVLRRAYDSTLSPESGSAWDEFWSKGLLGMFMDRFGSRG